MRSRIDHAVAYYWRIAFFEPDDPDDDRYIMLHGDEGEIVGPLTVRLAEAWIDRSACGPTPSEDTGLVCLQTLTVQLANLLDGQHAE